MINGGLLGLQLMALSMTKMMMMVNPVNQTPASPRAPDDNSQF